MWAVEGKSFGEDKENKSCRHDHGLWRERKSLSENSRGSNVQYSLLDSSGSFDKLITSDKALF